jgi:hypothetical protein
MLVSVRTLVSGDSALTFYQSQPSREGGLRLMDGD